MFLCEQQARTPAKTGLPSDLEPDIEPLISTSRLSAVRFQKEPSRRGGEVFGRPPPDFLKYFFDETLVAAIQLVIKDEFSGQKWPVPEKFRFLTKNRRFSSPKFLPKSAKSVWAGALPYQPTACPAGPMLCRPE